MTTVFLPGSDAAAIVDMLRKISLSRELPALTRFAVSGGASAAVYYCVAWWVLHRLHGSMFAAGLVGYLAAMPIAYALHRLYTFRSRDRMLAETSRFIAGSITGTVLAMVAPAALVRLGASDAMALIATCVLVPLTNYLLLSRWVFSRARRNG
ncbi:MAG TPA: GtrA family protein [Povalibacter sp.]|nr:GtrA family protein [Povalibacter sp.]